MASRNKEIKKILEKQDRVGLKLAQCLTVLQRRYAEEYVIDFMPQRAAIRAGYAEKYANRQAYQNNQNEAIQAYILYLTRSKAAKIMTVSPELLLTNLSDIMNKEGARDSDKLRAIEMYMKHLGMFVERQEITGKDGGAIEVEQRQIQQEANSFLESIKSMTRRTESKTDTLN